MRVITEAQRERKRELDRVYRLRNAERLREYDRRRNRTERRRQQSRECYRRNAEEHTRKTSLYQAKNPQKKRAWQRKYYYSHREQESKRKKLAYAADPALFAARVKRYRESDQERKRALVATITDNRRLRLSSAKGRHTAAQWLARVRFFGWKCRYCKTELTTETLTKDHRIPLIRGGTSWASNLVPACRSCNFHKHTMTEFEFLARTT